MIDLIPTTHAYWDPTLSITTRKNFFSLISKVLPQGKTRVTRDLRGLTKNQPPSTGEICSLLYDDNQNKNNTRAKLRNPSPCTPTTTKKNYDTPTLLSPTTRIEVSIFFVPFLHYFHLSALSYYRRWNIQVWATLRIPKVHIPPFNITLQAISTWSTILSLTNWAKRSIYFQVSNPEPTMLSKH